MTSTGLFESCSWPNCQMVDKAHATACKTIPFLQGLPFTPKQVKQIDDGFCLLTEQIDVSEVYLTISDIGIIECYPHLFF